MFVHRSKMSLLKQMLWKGFEWIMYMDLVLIASENQTLCGTPPHCCKDYEVNRLLNSCSSCLPGYHGAKCQLPCRYPSYGQLCQFQCACDEEQCHFINGCVNSSLANRKNQQNEKNSDENLTSSDDRKENRNTQEECFPEYYGITCGDECLFPNYGLHCQSKCNCSKVQCHRISGCLYTDENMSTTETTSTWAEYSRTTSDKVFMSTFAVQDDNVPFLQHLKQHLPLYVCFVIIFMSVSLNVVFIVRLLKNNRRIVKERSVGKNEDTHDDEYVNLRSQLRSDVMYTNMQRKEGASYLEIEEMNMRSMHGVPPF
uniref:Uncharacterized protein LOC111102503 n=1 Tax=Crassostrea virginica TaxID=6565 RepID=A0A8B8AIJ8_CRAVI|nr:uncharacterized protein LOC111102503 [Crassostrea virginica]